GLNPKDGRIYLATHSGVLLVGGDGVVTRIADRYQDTMGFAVVGPDRFLASGHPDLRENKPPRLGLIRSDDAALTWEPVSLGGESDLHAIVVVGGSIFAADASEGALLVSSDAGRTWSTLSNVELAVLAVEPGDAGTMVGTDFEGRMLRSGDGGRTWRPTGGPVLATLAWDSAVGLVGADASGVVFASADAGSSWRQVGDLAGVGPVVTTADGVVYAATDGGKIFRSSDGGRSWLPAG
ncbi:MAG: F510_1955 family glycosylhydrolase, partial [Microthrixaceae bacterium]